MNRILKTTILSAGIAATILATLPAANADDWRWRRHHHDHGDALAAGVVGLAAGALIAGALSNPQPRYSYYDDDYDYQPAPVRRYYAAPVRRYYAAPRVVYADRYAEPWTRAWYEYCSDRYRTFNSRTGTFVGYDGDRHFCVAN